MAPTWKLSSKPKTVAGNWGIAEGSQQENRIG
jgi:hypothetical protein